MSKICSVVNKKGGVAKSTTVGALASICAHYGEKVLVIDLDPQTDTTKLFYKGIRTNSIREIFKKSENEITYSFMKTLIKPSEYPNIDIIIGDDELDEEGDIILIQNGSLSSNRKVEIKKSAQMMLTKAFKLIEDDYDLIIIDNTPYFNIISRNALSASDAILIPVNNDGFSYDGLTKLLGKIYEVKRELNTNLDIIGVFFTDVKKRSVLHRQLGELLENELEDKFLKTYISSDNTVNEANTEFIPLLEYTKNSKKIPNATKDYMFLVSELELLKPRHKKIMIKDIEDDYKKLGGRK